MSEKKPGTYRRVPIVRLCQDTAGKWYWRLQGANNRIVGVGTHRHDTLAQARREIQRIAASRAMYTWSAYTDRAGEWRWRATHRKTGDVVCGSHEDFSSHAAAVVSMRIPYRILSEWERDCGVRVLVDRPET